MLASGEEDGTLYFAMSLVDGADLREMPAPPAARRACARVRLRARPPTRSTVDSLTSDRAFVGTVDYVAPEQIHGTGVDGRVDVYSLACVMHEALTGEGPFARESELATVFAHLNEPPPRPSTIRPELPAALDEVLATALAKEPDER